MKLTVVFVCWPAMKLIVALNYYILESLVFSIDPSMLETSLQSLHDSTHTLLSTKTTLKTSEEKTTIKTSEEKTTFKTSADVNYTQNE